MENTDKQDNLYSESSNSAKARALRQRPPPYALKLAVSKPGPLAMQHGQHATVREFPTHPSGGLIPTNFCTAPPPASRGKEGERGREEGKGKGRGDGKGRDPHMQENIFC